MDSLLFFSISIPCLDGGPAWEHCEPAGGLQPATWPPILGGARVCRTGKPPRVRTGMLQHLYRLFFFHWHPPEILHKLWKNLKYQKWYPKKVPNGKENVILRLCKVAFLGWCQWNSHPVCIQNWYIMSSINKWGSRACTISFFNAKCYSCVSVAL